MKTVLILRGIPASGKSTFAKALVKKNPGMYKRINRDDLRHMLDSYHFSKGNEKFIKRTRDWLILEGLKDGKHVIVDDTNLSAKNTNRIKEIVKNYNKETGEQVIVKIKEFEIDVEEAIARDAQRVRPVGAAQIRKMHRQFYGKKIDERGPNYKPQDPTLPKAIICDLDGTLAILNGRNPFDASTCEEDLLNQPVFDVVKNYYDLGYQVILLTGRTDNYKEPTQKWLEKYSIPHHQLIMRKHGDSRKDSVIKLEIFEANIKGKYFIQFVLDDRNQVVDMWRNEMGLACLQVNYGNF